MTPEQYRDKMGPSGPTIRWLRRITRLARSQLAKKMGLGQQRRRRKIARKHQEGGGKRLAGVGAKSARPWRAGRWSAAASDACQIRVRRNTAMASVARICRGCTARNRASAGLRSVRAQYARRCRPDNSATARRRCRGRSCFCKPDLAGAALHLVGGAMFGFRHRVQRTAEFDDIPVAVVPKSSSSAKLSLISSIVMVSRAPMPRPYIGDRRRSKSEFVGWKIPDCSGRDRRFTASGEAATPPSRSIRLQGVACLPASAVSGSALLDCRQSKPVWSDERLSVMI